MTKTKLEEVVRELGRTAQSGLDSIVGDGEEIAALEKIVELAAEVAKEARVASDPAPQKILYRLVDEGILTRADVMGDFRFYGADGDGSLVEATPARLAALLRAYHKMLLVLARLEEVDLGEVDLGEVEQEETPDYSPLVPVMWDEDLDAEDRAALAVLGLRVPRPGERCCPAKGVEND